MKYIQTILFTIGLVNCVFSMDTTPAKVSMELKNLPDGVVFYLIRQSVNSPDQLDTLESATSRIGRVDFKTNLKADGELLFVSLDTMKVKLSEGKQTWISFFVDASDMHIKGDMKNWPEADMTSSRATIAYEAYHRLKAPFVKDVEKALAERGKSKSPEDSVKVKIAMEKYRTFAMDYFRKNIDVLSTPLMISKSYPLSIEDRKVLREEMSDATKESFFGRKMEKVIEVMAFTETNTAMIDKEIPDIRLESVDGNVMSIREIAKGSEYTLIDFWAYWCSPCKEEIPKIKKVYEEFHQRGFNVISVSIDPNTPKWLNAVEALDVKWVNLIDKEQIIKRMFSVAAIPGHVLLNKKGEIIAMNIIGNKNNGTSKRYFEAEKGVRIAGDNLQGVIKGLIDND